MATENINAIESFRNLAMPCLPAGKTAGDLDRLILSSQEMMRQFLTEGGVATQGGNILIYGLDRLNFQPSFASTLRSRSIVAGYITDLASLGFDIRSRVKKYHLILGSVQESASYVVAVPGLLFEMGYWEDSRGTVAFSVGGNFRWRNESIDNDVYNLVNLTFVNNIKGQLLSEGFIREGDKGAKKIKGKLVRTGKDTKLAASTLSKAILIDLTEKNGRGRLPSPVTR